MILNLWICYAIYSWLVHSNELPDLLLCYFVFEFFLESRSRAFKRPSYTVSTWHGLLHKFSSLVDCHGLLVVNLWITVLQAIAYNNVLWTGPLSVQVIAWFEALLRLLLPIDFLLARTSFINHQSAIIVPITRISIVLTCVAVWQCHIREIPMFFLLVSPYWAHDGFNNAQLCLESLIRVTAL